MVYKKRLVLGLLSLLLAAVLLILILVFILKFFNNKKHPDVISLATPAPFSTPGVLGAKPDKPTPTPEPSPTPTATPTPIATPIPTPGSSPSLSGCQSTAGEYTLNVTVKGGSQSTPDISLTFMQPLNQETTSGGEVRLPGGWNIPTGSSLAQGEVMGNGCMSYVLDGVSRSIEVSVINDQDTMGHRARWNIVFGEVAAPAVTLESFIDGDPTSGYTWTINRKFLFDVKPPITLNIVLLGQHFSKTSPTGNNLFGATVKFVEGANKLLNSILSLF